MITLKLHRDRQVGDDWFGHRPPPGRELAGLERTVGAQRWCWSLRQEHDEAYVWRRALASSAVTGRWRGLGVHWKLIAVLTPSQREWLGGGADPRAVLLDALEAHPR